MTPAPPILHRWRAFAVLAVAYFMTIVDLTIVNVALPTIGRELHFSESNLQWVVTAYGVDLRRIPAARRTRRRPAWPQAHPHARARRVHRSLARLRTGDDRLAPDRDARSAGARRRDHAPGRAVDRDEHVPRRRGAQQGARAPGAAIAACGATVGLIMGGLLTRYLGWEYIFYLNVPIGALALLACPADRPRESARDQTPPLRPLRRPHRHRRPAAHGLRTLAGAERRLE